MMIDLIVFKVGSNSYALNIENIQRIIQAEQLTNIPNAHELIDGMMSYENDVIKVLNFRKLIGLCSYDEELEKLFKHLKKSHKEWINELKSSVSNGTEFTKTLDPHKCQLGSWLDDFNSYDEHISELLKSLVENHKHLHLSGAEILALSKDNQEKAQERIEAEIDVTFEKTMNSLDTFISELPTVSDSLQKFILYEAEGRNFAIKVDSIEDIAHIQDDDVMCSDEEHNKNEFLELDGILDLNGILINVIKTVAIPS